MLGARFWMLFEQGGGALLTLHWFNRFRERFPFLGSPGCASFLRPAQARRRPESVSRQPHAPLAQRTAVQGGHEAHARYDISKHGLRLFLSPGWRMLTQPGPNFDNMLILAATMLAINLAALDQPNLGKSPCFGRGDCATACAHGDLLCTLSSIILVSVTQTVCTPTNQTPTTAVHHFGKRPRAPFEGSRHLRWERGASSPRFGSISSRRLRCSRRAATPRCRLSNIQTDTELREEIGIKQTP